MDLSFTCIMEQFCSLVCFFVFVILEPPSAPSELVPKWVVKTFAYSTFDGRRANCNLASLVAQKNRPISASQHGMEKVSPPPRVMAPSNTGTPVFDRQLIPQYAFPYSAYGYPGYTQDIYSMNYYNVYGGQQFPSHFTTGTSGSPGVYLSYFPLYPQHGQSSPSQYPSQQYRAFGTLTLPPAASPSLLAATAAPATSEVAGKPGIASAQNSSV